MQSAPQHAPQIAAEHFDTSIATTRLPPCFRSARSSVAFLSEKRSEVFRAAAVTVTDKQLSLLTLLSGVQFSLLCFSIKFCRISPLSRGAGLMRMLYAPSDSPFLSEHGRFGKQTRRHDTAVSLLLTTIIAVAPAVYNNNS